MYFNLIIGAVVLGALIYLGKTLLAKLRSPRAILLEEMEERRRRSERVQENIQRVRERAVERMRPIHRAVQEMNAALLEAQRFTVEGEGEVVTLRQNGTLIRVTYQLANFAIDGTVTDLANDVAQYERFFIEVTDDTRNSYVTREAVTHEEAIRLIAREMATLLQH